MNTPGSSVPPSTVVPVSTRRPTGLISTIEGPSMVTSMVPVVCTIPLPAGSYTAPSPMARVGAAPAVSIWVALRMAQMVLTSVVLVATWSRVTLPSCPLTANPE